MLLFLFENEGVFQILKLTVLFVCELNLFLANC
jgi:hypothetical protein